MLFIDTETRAVKDLVRTGAYHYWRHHLSEVIQIGWMDDQMDRATWISVRDLASPTLELRQRIEAGEPIVVHNYQFELLAYHACLQARYDWPAQPQFLHDTAAMARSMGLPAHLDTLVRCIQMCLNQPIDGKDLTGRQVMLKFCKPGANGDWYWNEAEYQLLGRYCAKDVELTRKVFHALRALDSDEVIHLQLTEKINARGVKVDVALATQLVALADDEVADINAHLAGLTGGAVTSVTKVADLKAWLTMKTGREFVTANAFVLRETLLLEDLDPVAREVIELRLLGAKTSVAKISTMLEALDPDDHRIRGMLLFNGAGKTGRWSSKIVQLHNMPRAGYGKATEQVIGAIRAGGAAALRLLFPNVMDELPKLIRSLLIADTGKKFICGDFAGVEARILVWLAQAQRKLRLYHNDEDVYAATAAELGYKDRQIGKTCELALGYAGGVAALESMAQKFGVQISATEAQEVVKRWRKANPKVVSLWYRIWGAACKAMTQPDTTFHVVEPLGLSYLFDGVHLWCRLPSGRLICNPFADAVYVDGPYGAELEIRAVSASNLPAKDATEWPKITLWAGILTENICQAIGADLLRWAILALEKQEFDVVLHAHDEFVCEVPKKTTIETVAHPLKSLPDWAQGLPFDISWWEGQRYRK